MRFNTEQFNNPAFRTLCEYYLEDPPVDAASVRFATPRSKGGRSTWASRARSLRRLRMCGCAYSARTRTPLS